VVGQMRYNVSVYYELQKLKFVVAFLSLSRRMQRQAMAVSFRIIAHYHDDDDDDLVFHHIQRYIISTVEVSPLNILMLSVNCLVIPLYQEVCKIVQ
jgi:hypothetical protein